MRAFTVTRPSDKTADPETVFFQDAPTLNPASVAAQLIHRDDYPADIQVKERKLTPQDIGLVRAINQPTPSAIAAGLAAEAHKTAKP